MEQRPAGGRLQIERYTLLVRVQIGEQKAALMMRFVAGEGRQTARRIPLRSLDLDDLCAEVGKELRAVRAGDMVCQVKDAHAL